MTRRDDMPGFSIRRQAAQPVMSIREWTTVPEIGRALAERLPVVWAYVKASGGAPAGPPFTRYHAVEGGRVDLEAGLPVREPLAPSGRIQPGELPAGEAAVAMHRGAYERLPETGGRLEAWVAEQGRAPAGPRYELYVTDPGGEPDPERWETEVVQPLR